MTIQTTTTMQTSKYNIITNGNHKARVLTSLLEYINRIVWLAEVKVGRAQAHPWLHH